MAGVSGGTAEEFKGKFLFETEKETSYILIWASRYFIHDI